MNDIKRRLYLAQLEKAFFWASLTFLGAWAVNHYHLDKLDDAFDIGISFLIIWAIIFGVDAWRQLRKLGKSAQPPPPPPPELRRPIR